MLPGLCSRRCPTPSEGTRRHSRLARDHRVRNLRRRIDSFAQQPNRQWQDARQQSGSNRSNALSLVHESEEVLTMMRTSVPADGHAECRVPTVVAGDGGKAPSVVTCSVQAPWERGTDSARTRLWVRMQRKVQASRRCGRCAVFTWVLHRRLTLSRVVRSQCLPPQEAICETTCFSSVFKCRIVGRGRCSILVLRRILYRRSF